MLDFTSLEIQLIRSSLTNRTDEEIAELLERAVDEVREKVKEISEITPEQRQAEVIRFKADKKKRIARKPAVIKQKKQVEKKEELNRTEKQQMQRKRIIRHEEARKAELRKREERKTFRTRKVDYSKMKSVRVNRQTFVWVDKSISDAEAIRKYYDNRDHYSRKHLSTIKK